MKRVLRRAVPAAVLAMAGLSGCVSHVHYPLEAPSVTASAAPAPVGLFDYDGAAGSPALRRGAGRERGYATHRLSMPASFENGQPDNLVTGTYYASPSPGKKPLVIVLPVWGVSDYPSTKMTKTILRRSDGSMNVLRIDGKKRLVDWKAIEQAATRREFIDGVANAARRLKHAVIDIRRLVDWAQTSGEIDDSRIGLIGFSISALSGTLATQIDSRIQSSVLVMGGAEIGRIVSQCPGNEKKTRDAILERLDIGLQAYQQTVDELFAGLDPVDYPSRADPRDILIVDARKDECIPARSREAWWQSLGRPERLSFNYSHRQSFLAMTPLGLNFLRRKAYDHLARTL